MPPLILASASPRRRQLLEILGFTFTVQPADIDEALTGRLAPPLEAQVLALRKVLALERRMPPDAVVIAADTLVVLDGEVLGKPEDPGDAIRMLRALRGREHEVATGVAVMADGAVEPAHRVTVVRMRDYSDAEIDAFVGSGRAMDKAGAYAIQDPAFRPVHEIEGCYCNVVGLPAGLLLERLRRAGYEHTPPQRPPQCAGCPDWEAAP